MGPAALMGGSSILGGASSAVGAAGNEQQQMNIANYNATALRQEANQATDASSANEASMIRRDAGTLGDQGAGFAQAGIGTGAGVQAIEKQSATNARMNELNTWYGGELERSSLLNQADFQDWQAKQIKDSQKVPWWDPVDALAQKAGPLGYLINPIGKLTGINAYTLLKGGGAGQVGQGTAQLMATSNYRGGGGGSPY